MGKFGSLLVDNTEDEERIVLQNNKREIEPTVHTDSGLKGNLTMLDLIPNQCLFCRINSPNPDRDKDLPSLLSWKLRGYGLHFIGAVHL